MATVKSVTSGGLDAAESRIGYGNAMFANAGNLNLGNRRRFAYSNLAALNAANGYSGYGVDSSGAGSNNLVASESSDNAGQGGLNGAGAGGVGYLDYFDGNQAGSVANGNNGLGLDYAASGLTFVPRRAGGFRRRNGLLNAGAAALGGLANGLAGGGGGSGGLTGMGGLAGLGNGLKSAATNAAGNLMALPSSGYGHSGGGYGHSGGGHSGYGAPVNVVSGYGPSQQCESGLNPLIVLLTLAGAAIGFYFIYIKLTMSGGRTFGGTGGNIVDTVADVLWIGLEEFEDKVDKIANGQEDDSWISQLYRQFSANLGIDGAKIDPSEIGSQEGLEPPILDETWGLEDIQKLHAENDNADPSTSTSEDSDVNQPKSRSKRDDPVVDEEIHQNDIDKDDADDDYTNSLVGEDKCKAKFWKCVGSVATDSIHYVQEPGGIQGALQKMLFRVAFHGGIGNVWNALMTIPEARRIKRCMNKQDECIAFEVLAKEVETFGGDQDIQDADNSSKTSTKDRLLINPEFVESMDKSDGSEKFSPEDQKLEDELAE